MTAFLALASASFAALDTVFGEPLTITPQSAGEFTAPGADPAIPPYVVTGILDSAALIVDPGGQLAGTRSEAVTTAPVAEFAFSQFGVGAPLPLVGWRIDAAADPLRGPASGFLISARLPDGSDGRIRFQLAALT
jgi:hypothetical protein